MALIPFEDSSFLWGQAGIAGTGITEGEKTTITGDLNALKAVKYIVQEASATTSAEQSLGALTTGLLKNTVAAGVGTLSAAVAGDLPAHTHFATATFQFTIDDGGGVITTGVKEYCDLAIPYGCAITYYSLVGNPSGSIVLDIWEDSHTNYPPTVADTIIGAGAKPTISSNIKNTTNSLTSWDTSLAAANFLRINVVSVTSMTRATLTLFVLRGIS